MSIDWNEVDALIRTLFDATDRLEAIFPGRKFTLDGHLVGSIGEVIAAHMFDLTLNAASTRGHDAIAVDGRRVEIKFTQGKQVAFRHCPDHAIVLARPRSRKLEVVYNGPGHLLWDGSKPMPPNGQRPVSLAKLRRLDREVEHSARLRQVLQAPL